MKANRAKMSKLIARCIRASGYASADWAWEVHLDHGQHDNHPFRPLDGPRADAWGGDSSPLNECLADIRPGHELDCAVFEADTLDLHTNVTIRVVSETYAQVREAGHASYLTVN